MNLESLRKIAAARTSGPYHAIFHDGWTLVGSALIGEIKHQKDCLFLASASAHFDQMLAVCEAAKKCFDPNYIGDFYSLKQALAQLEKA